MTSSTTAACRPCAMAVMRPVSPACVVATAGSDDANVGPIRRYRGPCDIDRRVDRPTVRHPVASPVIPMNAARQQQTGTQHTVANPRGDAHEAFDAGDAHNVQRLHLPRCRVLKRQATHFNDSSEVSHHEPAVAHCHRRPQLAVTMGVPSTTDTPQPCT